MNDMNPLRDMFRSAVRAPLVTAAPAQKSSPEVTLDAAGNPITEGTEKPKGDDQPVLDGTGDYASTDIDLKVAAAIQEWAETDASDLDDGEGYADRLFAMLVGIADVDMDGEISDDEADVVEMAADSAWDYLSEKGVSDDDLEALLNDWDNDVAARVHELVVSKLPDGDEASADDIDAFAFGDGSDEAALDATYKKKVVVRKGKKMRVLKRVSGTIRLSAKQKLSVRKMLRKSHGAKATMRRAKSMRVRRQMGI